MAVWQYPTADPKGKDLFFSLLSKCKKEEYDDEYLELLAKYGDLYQASENFLVFCAKYALYNERYDLALNYAQQANKKRKIMQEIWEIFFLVYEHYNRRKEGLPYQGFLSSFYCQSLKLSSQDLADSDVLKYLSRSMGTGNYAPLMFTKLQNIEGKIVETKCFWGGEFIPRIHVEDVPLYWAGVYGDENSDLFGHGILLQSNKDNKVFFNTGGADFVFDLMKSKAQKEYLKTDFEPLILPIAGTQEKQIVYFSSEEEKIENVPSVLGMWQYNFYRLDKPTKITSEEECIFGTPIILKHSEKRYKLVLNILIDGLCWRAMRENNYELLPHTMEFFADGIIFSDHQSVSEYTFPSLATIETGMYPENSQIFQQMLADEIDAEYITTSERMKELGYYTLNLLGSGDGVYNGVTRGFDRLLINPYKTPIYWGVERTIRSIEAFRPCDQFIFLHTLDAHPWDITRQQISLQAQVNISLRDRLALGDIKRTKSVDLPNAPLYREANRCGIMNVDRSLKTLYDYLRKNYCDDEYVVNLYSDHGTSIYAHKNDKVGEYANSATLMIRGAKVPKLGFVDELTSTADIYQIMAFECGFPVGENVDGVLPRSLGGSGRKYTVSSSIFPDQTYKLSLRTKEYACRLESLGTTNDSGMADLRGANIEFYRRENPLALLSEDEEQRLYTYFLPLIKKHTAKINNEGQVWDE